VFRDPNSFGHVTRAGGVVVLLTLGALTFSLIDENQAASGHDTFLDNGTITYKDTPHGTFEIVSRDGRVVVADDPGETVVVDPAGTVTRIPNSSSRMADLQFAQQTALATLSLGQQGATSGGSSTQTFETPLQLQPINFFQSQNNGTARCSFLPRLRLRLINSSSKRPY
jgi:hypothetical protein